MKRALIGFLAWLFAAASFGPAASEPRRLYPQVDGLFERVAINPGAKFYGAPNGFVTSSPDAFSIYYVFDDRSVGGATWLHVGPSADRDATAWMKKEDGTDLRHLLIVAPQSRQNRERALFFESMNDLEAVATSRNRVSNFAALLEEVDAGDVPQGVVGIQPENQPAISEAFSFMPIRSVESRFAPGLGNVRLFETLSIPLPPAGEGSDNFQTGIVFVVDTTTSMGPYIEGVRKMMRNVSTSLIEAAPDDKVSFGIVAYRDDVSLRPELQYTTKVAFPLQEDFDASGFDQAIAGLSEAPVSSPDFQEDAIAGLDAALELPGWENFEKRVVILITDAPTRGEGRTGMSSTGLSPASIILEAEEKRISLVSLYLTTPDGNQFHSIGRRQYLSLTKWRNGQSAMEEIRDGNFETYFNTIDRLVRGVSGMLESDNPNCENPSGLGGVDQILCEIEDRTAAVRLEWLGRRQGVAAPAISSAWVSDVSLDSERAATQTMAFQPYLLLTRNQLNDLVRVLDELVRIPGADIDQNREEALRIFQGALSRGAVNNDLLQAVGSGGGNAVTLSDYSPMSDFLPAFLAELPLKSRFMDLEVGAWIDPASQAVHMSEVRSKIIEYRDYLEDDDRWIALSDGADYGDLVYPVPWDRIP